MAFEAFRFTARLCSGLVLLAAISACSFGPGNIQSRHSTDIEVRKIRRIAVIPQLPDVDQKAAAPFTSKPAEAVHPDDLLARDLYAALVAQPGWQIVSDREIEEVAHTMGPLTDAARQRRLGEAVYADAVMTARVLRYRERIGNEVGAKSPASVAFVVELVDVRRGDTIWSARFDETQKPLSENLFAIGDIGQRGLRWLSADQLMLEGVKKAVSQLHQIIVQSRTP